MLFTTGLLLKRIQWNAHLYSMLAHQAQTKLVQKRGNLKFVRQAKSLKRNANSIDFLLKTRDIAEKDALHKLVIDSNKMCISLSNLLNELIFRNLAHTKSMQHWTVVGNVNNYHAGSCCMILELILDKLFLANKLDQIEGMEYKLKEASQFLENFENEMSKKTSKGLTQGDIKSLMLVHLLFEECLLQFIKKKCQ